MDMTATTGRKARLVWASLAVLPFALHVFDSRFADDVSLAKEAQRSIVFVTLEGVREGGGEIEPRQASGFVIDKVGHLITVNHIFKDTDGRAYQSIRNLKGVFGGTIAESPRDLEVVDTKEPQDLALLKLKERPTSMTLAPVVICPNEPEAGTELVGFGFPRGKGFATVKGSFNNPSGQGGRWQVTMAVSEGMSGGPVYDRTGHVRAVVKQGVPGQAATTSVIPIQYAGSFAVRADSNCEGEETWKKPLIIGGSVAAITGGAYALFHRNTPSVAFQNARFDPAEVQCRAGTVNVPLPFTILVDFDATGSGASVSGATLTMRIEETFQTGETVGTEASFPTTSVTPTQLGEGKGTFRLNSELRCTNPTGDDRVANRWRGLLSIVHSAGTAATLQTSNLLTVRDISNP
jgi:hypothetical protein